jgi:hypothetical protein
MTADYFSEYLVSVACDGAGVIGNCSIVQKLVKEDFPLFLYGTM